MVVLLKNEKEPIDPYNEHFRALNFECQFVPLLEHEPVNEQELAMYLRSEEFASIDSIIVTSQRAIEALETHLDSLDDEQKVTLLSKPSYTVGAASARELETIGFTDIRGAERAGNGSILAELILGETYQSFVFFTGEVRRDIIPKRLQEAQRTVIEKVVYKTSDKSDTNTRFQNAVQQSSDAWIVFFSPSGTADIIAVLKNYDENDQKFKLACIGPTTRDYLIKHGFTPDAVAAKPNEVDLARAIIEKQQHETPRK